jgi:hypothetical protein
MINWNIFHNLTFFEADFGMEQKNGNLGPAYKGKIEGKEPYYEDDIFFSFYLL